MRTSLPQSLLILPSQKGRGPGSGKNPGGDPESNTNLCQSHKAFEKNLLKRESSHEEVGS